MGLKLPKFYSFFGSKKFRWKKNCGKELAKKLLSSSCTFQKSFLAPHSFFLSIVVLVTTFQRVNMENFLVSRTSPSTPASPLSL